MATERIRVCGLVTLVRTEFGKDRRHRGFRIMLQLITDCRTVEGESGASLRQCPIAALHAIWCVSIDSESSADNDIRSTFSFLGESRASSTNSESWLLNKPRWQFQSRRLCCPRSSVSQRGGRAISKITMARVTRATRSSHSST